MPADLSGIHIRQCTNPSFKSQTSAPVSRIPFTCMVSVWIFLPQSRKHCSHKQHFIGHKTLKTPYPPLKSLYIYTRWQDS
jgi:hypothetical protein